MKFDVPVAVGVPEITPPLDLQDWAEVVRVELHDHKQIVYLQSKDEISALNRTRYVALSRERNKFSKPLDDLKKQAEQVKAQETGRTQTLQTNSVTTDIALKRIARSRSATRP